jgi:integrase
VSGRTRRPNGDGTISSRETKTKGVVWDVQLSLKDRDTGITDRVTKRGFRTQKEATDWRNKKMREASLRLYTKPKAITMPQLVRQYIDERPELAPSTHDSYERALRLHIGTALNVRAEAVDRRTLQRFATSGPGPQARSVAVRVVKSAVAWGSRPDVGLLPYNHLGGSRITLGSTGTGGATAIPRDTLARIIAATGDEQTRLAWLLGVHCGPRRGEIIGLNWSDFNFARGQVWLGHIGSPESTGKERVKRTKGRKGRWVPLPRGLVRDFQRLKLARGASDSDPVFVTVKGPRRGLRWSFRVIETRWQRSMSAAGVSGHHPHELRHTFATIALEQGMPVQTVSKLLGHSQIATTVNTYLHVIQGSEANVALAVQDGLGLIAPDPIASKTASRPGIIPLEPRREA